MRIYYVNRVEVVNCMEKYVNWKW